MMKIINRRGLMVGACVLACVLALALAQSALVSAQVIAVNNTTITGRVIDPQGAGVPGAIVTLYARRESAFGLTTMTDATGAYRFERLAAGEYLVEAEAEGFASASAQRLDVRRGQAAALEITLQLSGVRSTIVVTASNTPQSIDEVSKAVTVVDKQEMDERDETSIAEALRIVPGLRVQQLGGPGSFTSIKTRGLRNEDTAVLIDGLRFRDAASTQGDASGFLEDLIVTDEATLKFCAAPARRSRARMPAASSMSSRMRSADRSTVICSPRRRARHVSRSSSSDRRR
ncbi:MAG: carboxypeptidase regulatory-like domain-containing protein [Pyrinomonadaceae bacterium]